MIKTVSLFIITSMALASCARPISSDVYTARQAGEASITYMGVIKNVREVCVEEDHSQTGTVAGGLSGGVLGSAIGKGNFFSTAGGAIAGAVTGALIEKKLKQQTALEYIVELDDGGLMTIVQGDVLNVGQPVYVIVSPLGRSRIISQ